MTDPLELPENPLPTELEERFVTPDMLMEELPELQLTELELPIDVTQLSIETLESYFKSAAFPGVELVSTSDGSKMTYAEAVKPFLKRWETASKRKVTDSESKEFQDVTEAQSKLSELIKYAESVYDNDSKSGMNAILNANIVAGKILSTVDEKGNIRASKQLSPQQGQGEQRQFTGKKMLDRYSTEKVTDRQKYESARRNLDQSADYIDKDGFLVDSQGRRINASGKDAMYTSRLEDGTSHRFKEGVANHSYAAQGNEVIGAGTRVVKDGIVRTITGDSGHYAPSAKNIHEYVEALIEQGVKTVDDVTLFMPNPQYVPGNTLPPNDPKSQQYVVATPKVHEDWKKVVAYETNRKETGDKSPYDPEIAKLKQMLADLNIAPGQKEAIVDGLREGLLIAKDDFENTIKKSTEGQLNEVEKAAKTEQAIVKMFTDRFGPTIVTTEGNVTPIRAKGILGTLNINRGHHKLPFLKSITEMTADDVNMVMGVFIRLRLDVNKQGKSEARAVMPASQFVQTGGNVEAINAKDNLSESLLNEVEQVESNVNINELYNRSGGNEKLGKIAKISNIESIDINLRYAWLVKGRIPDDQSLHQLLMQRFGEKYFNALTTYQPGTNWKLTVLAADAWTDDLIAPFKSVESDDTESSDESEDEASGGETSQGSNQVTPNESLDSNNPNEPSGASKYFNMLGNAPTTRDRKDVSERSDSQNEGNESSGEERSNSSNTNETKSTVASNYTFDNLDENETNYAAILDNEVFKSNQSSEQSGSENEGNESSGDERSDSGSNKETKSTVASNYTFDNEDENETNYAAILDNEVFKSNQSSEQSGSENEGNESSGEERSDSGSNKETKSTVASNYTFDNEDENETNYAANLDNEVFKSNQSSEQSGSENEGNESSGEERSDSGSNNETKSTVASKYTFDNKDENETNYAAILDNEEFKSNQSSEQSGSENEGNESSGDERSDSGSNKEDLEAIAKYTTKNEDTGTARTDEPKEVEVKPEPPIGQGKQDIDPPKQIDAPQPTTTTKNNGGPEKVDLRKVKNSTTTDPREEAFEKLGGDTKLHEFLLSYWKRQSVEGLNQLKQLENARNEKKAPLAELRQSLEKAGKKAEDIEKDPTVVKFEEELKLFDLSQKDEREKLRAELNDSRPTIGFLSMVDIGQKLAMLEKPSEQGFNSLLERIKSESKNKKDK